MLPVLLAVLAAPVPAPPSPIRLVEVASERGLDFRHDFGRDRLRWIVETTGSGACAGDFDGDADDDLLLVNGGVLDPGDAASRPPRERTRFYLNEKGSFRDATLAAGLPDGPGFGMGCATADVDGDGDLDVLLTRVGVDALLLNDGRARFRDVAAAAGVADPRWTTSAAFADHDGDGDLDLYVGAYVDFRLDGRSCATPDGRPMLCLPRDYAGIPGRLYRNEGGARFTDVTTQAGAVEPSGKTLGVIFEDLTGDGRPDLYLANDTERNTLLVGDGTTFRDASLAAGVGYAESGRAMAGMGVEAGDLDGDLLPDLVVTNFHLEPNSVFRSLGSARWADESHASGMADASFLRLGFGVSLADLDLDGDLDVFVANGHVDDGVEAWDGAATYRQRNQVMENLSRPGSVRLRDVTATALAAPASVGRGSAWLDLEGDGDPDIVVNASGGPVQLLENRSRGGAWIAVRLQGPPPNTQGIGALVEVEAAGRRQARRVRTSSSFLSASPARACFGLGRAPAARVTVRWPDGVVQDAGRLAAGAVHVVRRATVAEPAGARPSPGGSGDRGIPPGRR